MPLTPSSVRAGLVTRIETITGLFGYANIPDLVQPGHVLVDQLDVTFDFSGNRGSDQATVDLVHIVQRMDSTEGQSNLDDYLVGTGASSIKTAIEGDRTLGGACSTLRVISASPGQYNSAGIDYLAYRYRVQITG